MPNINRSIPVTRSAPIVDNQTPNIPPIKFLTAPPALILASIDKPNTVKAKYSGDRNSYATLANKGAAKPKIIVTAASVFILINSLSGVIGQLTKNQVLEQLLNYWPLLLAVLVGGQIGNFLNIKILRLILLELQKDLVW